MDLNTLLNIVLRAEALGRVAQVKLACNPDFEPILGMEPFADWVMLHGVDLETETIVPFSQIEAMRMVPKNPEG